MGNTASNHITESVISLTGPIVGLLSSTSSLIVIKVYLQDLHVLMKNLLYVLAGHSMISSSSIIIIEFFANDRSLDTCLMLYQASWPSNCITCGMFSFMSAIRFHIASKTQELQAVKAWKFYLVAGMIYISEHVYVPLSYLLARDFEVPFWATECASKYRFVDQHFKYKIFYHFPPYR